jgi:hypothetical protein
MGGGNTWPASLVSFCHPFCGELLISQMTGEVKNAEFRSGEQAFHELQNQVKCSCFHTDELYADAPTLREGADDA